MPYLDGDTQEPKITPIPFPPGFPVIGNLLDLDPDTPANSLHRLWQQHGEIWALRIAALLGREPIFVNSVALASELCDENRFTKKVAGALEEIRHGVHDGLFTAFPGEENWGIAHRVLMPAFGPLAITHMFDEMKDVVSQMVLKFARNGPTAEIAVTDDFTRLTLDSIALCAMDTRFNSFYHEKLHPFVDAMVGFLVESGHRSRRPQVQLALMRMLNSTSQYSFDKDIKFLQQVAMECVEKRRRQPSEKKDLLNAMLNGVDPKTGKKMSDQSICDNMITFLIAGHETTSGMLSFLFYYLLKNPKAYQAAQEEVDRVVGKSAITVDHMAKLPYLTACLRETLRLQPTAPGFGVSPKAGGGPVIIKSGDKAYSIPEGNIAVLSLPQIHRDPLVYGDDAEEFRPERMSEENFQKLPKNAWKPFGNGMRGCIGRPFAWQEALLATATLLQYFNFDFVKEYNLRIKQTLTIKPTADFKMHARLRPGVDSVTLEQSMFGGVVPQAQAITGVHPDAGAVKAKGRPMTILYGSNTGTCQALAQGLASDAASHGFNADILELDAAIERVPKDQPVVIITASFEGEPPDNAARFTEWMRRQKDTTTFSGIKYATFGCGHSDWQATFHAIPQEYDRTFASLGASRLVQMGSADAAKNQITGEFETWEPKLWEAIAQEFGEDTAVQAEEFEIEVRTEARSASLRQNVKEAKVVKNVKISQEDASEERHVEMDLPKGMEYRTGDYLAILPLNPQATVNRVLKHYSLPRDTVISVKSGRFPGISSGSTISLQDLLSGYVELSQPATRKSLEAVSRKVTISTTTPSLLELAGPLFESHILTPRISLLDILSRYDPLGSSFPLSSFLQSLPAMRIRSYSISSSALASPTRISLTISVLEAPSMWFSPDETGTKFLGVASNYIASLEAGESVQVAVRPSHQAFHPPSDPEETPVLMLCAGTGIAPFRGFCIERAEMVKQGRKLAKGILYVGVRREVDVLYKEEVAAWAEIGAVEVRHVFSRDSEKTMGCKYVQDRMWEEREELVELFDAGAKVFVCGSARLGEGVKDVVLKMYAETAEKRGKPKTEEEITKWFDGIRNERYAVDVFS